MARTLNRLSARAALTLAKAGTHADGGGLYLAISPRGVRQWSFIYRDRRTGRRREMGLGGVAGTGRPGVSLKEARTRAEAARQLLREGRDPIEARKAIPTAIVRPGILTFGEFTDDWLAGIEGGFRNEKHRAQWRMTLTKYAAPLRAKGLGEIGTDDVLAVLKPHWTRRPETASRLRGRIERVLDAAKARGLRDGENPARWRGHLDSLLTKPAKLARGHHAALPYDDLPAFMTGLNKGESISARALAFTIQTAARTGETIGAQWREIDFTKKIWTVPAERMKAHREHRVPLTDAAIRILKSVHVPNTAPNEFIFASAPGQALSQMALLMMLRDMRAGITVHGFRSTFRDWAGDQTSYPRDLIEEALAHVIKNATERAYRRSDALEKRRELMAAWSRYCAGGGKIVKLVRGK